MKLSNAINLYLEYCQIEKGKSAKTLENYNHYLKRFLKFCGDINVSKITPKIIRTYRLHLLTFKNINHDTISKKTQNYHLIALRSFLKYLQKNDIPSFSPEKIELIKQKTNLPDFLKAEEIIQLLNYHSDKKNILDFRNKAIINTLFSSGMRVSELVALKKENFSTKNNEIAINGKGGKNRIVFLSPVAIESIKQYLSMRKDIDPSLFVSHNRKNNLTSQLTPRSIQRIIKISAKKAGLVKKVTPHTLRHSFATDLLINGADIRSVQSLLGHSSITTTQIYTHITDKHLKETHQKFHSHNK